MSGALDAGEGADAKRAEEALQMCLVLVVRHGEDGDEVLLGVKRRGFGEGRVVAPGGKVDAGETPADAARRELLEETGLQAHELQGAGVLDFRFPHDDDTRDMRAHVSMTSAYDGTAVDSDEIAVSWTPLSAIPYDRMWADARHWVPRALDETLTSATFIYAADGRTLESFSINDDVLTPPTD